MQLIDKIEINYFRSIYKINMRALGNLNVIVGANDSGKSNLLRALNLFFNNETGYDEELRFLQDATHMRQKEAQDAKGRLTIWMKIHFNNVEKWKTLPDKFFVKKTWNRYSEEPEIKTNIDNQQAETRFLNKVRFHYIPAIKDKSIFSDYLYLLYETLAEREDIEFSSQANSLSKAINSAVGGMTKTIREQLKIDSQIGIPGDLESLFERLQFSTQQDTFSVPLANRGDGVQVRHIPYILDYICRNNRGLNIWAYEEPENSLEMSNSYRMAQEFERDFAKHNQLFVTSHSPAFYGLEDASTRHFLTRKVEQPGEDGSNFVTTVGGELDIEVADRELGVAKLITRRSAEAFKEIERLRTLNAELESLNKPVVLTEGKTDAIILRKAWEKLNPDEVMNFEIRSCDTGGSVGEQETAGADQLKKILEGTTPSDQCPRIGIFDRDAKGLGCFKKLSQHQFPQGEDALKLNSNGKSAALVLPLVEWGSPYDKYLENEVCIEMMFPYHLFDAAELEFDHFLEKKPISEAMAKGLIDRFEAEPVLFKELGLRTKPKFLQKVTFSQRIKDFKDGDFEFFEDLLSNIQKAAAELG